MKLRRLFGGVLLLAAALMGPSVVGNAAAQQYDYVVTDPEFGADPSDKETDRDEIQAALDKAIGSQSVITIYFPKGTYYIHRPLWVYSNTHIILDDDAVVYRNIEGLENNILHNVDQNGKFDETGGYNMSHDITLEGGTWDGGNISKATSPHDVIRFDHARNVTIKNCTIQNTYNCHLLELVGVKDSLVTNCVFQGFRYEKGKEKDYTYAREAIQLESAWQTDGEPWAKGAYVDGTSCKQVTVENSTFINMPCGVGQHRYTKSGKYRNANITIRNNTLTCASNMKACKTAITGCGTNGLLVQNNTVKGPYRFSVHVIQSDDVVIEKNNIFNTSMNGIMVDQGAITSIQNNKISSAAKHGISVGGGTVGKINGNTITGAKANGISVDGGTISSINNNIVKKPGNHGISIAAVGNRNTGGKVKEISGNQITNPKENGICMNLGKVTDIKNNTIKNSGKHGVSVVGGTIGEGSKKNHGIIGNTVTTCGQNGITVSQKGTVAAINSNKISDIKKNGISLLNNAKVYWVTGNTMKDCKKHGIWSQIKGVKNISENQITNPKENGICIDSGKITKIENNTIKDVGKHGIIVIGGTVGSGKKETNGLIGNEISGCKQNGITVSMKGTVTAISGNEITDIKNNGISLTGNAKVYLVTKNTMKKCKKYGIWNGLSGVTVKGNKGKKN